MCLWDIVAKSGDCPNILGSVGALKFASISSLNQVSEHNGEAQMVISATRRV